MKHSLQCVCQTLVYVGRFVCILAEETAVISIFPDISLSPLPLCSEGTMIFNTRAALSNDCIHDQPLAPPHCLSVAVNVTEGIVFTHNYINPIALVSQLVYVLSYSVIEFLLVQ